MPSDKLVVESLAGPHANESVVKVTGPLVLNNLFAFQNLMQEQTASVIRVSLTDVPCVDSAGLGSNVKFFVSCKRHDRKLVLVNPSEQVHSIMRMTRVETLFDIYPTLQAAASASASS